MPLRQVELVIPEPNDSLLETLTEGEFIHHCWQEALKTPEGGICLNVLLDASDTEHFLDRAEKHLGHQESFRLLVHAVEATLPRIKEPEPPEEEDPADSEPLEPWEAPLQGARVSREELYSEITDGIDLNRIYIAMVVLSTIVAALGVIRDNTAVVIGAMVIAPLLAPNIGLALATTLGDIELGLKSLKTNISGLLLALTISVVLGFFIDVDADVYQIASRTEVALSDIALALASGAAGVLAYTVGMSAAVIGVMVAVALLPPLVTAGLLLGDMQLELALYASLLLMTNVICVNLAAVGTFIFQGVRPRTWYETKTAKQANRYALTLWVVLVLVLASIIYYVWY
ncbi:MAG: TIGR00341 family protein [Balneolaceae bacterium]